MQQAPAWLPYRLRNWLDQARIESALRGLARTAPRPAAIPEQAAAEVHLLICRRDLRPGILTLKSLLRFASPAAPLAVTVTDDGTLTPRDRALVDHHLPGLRWLSWPAAGSAIEAALSARPHLLRLYHSRYAPVCKLLHATLLARSPRILVLDPDTAFFRPPARLLDFAQGRKEAPLYLHDHQDEAIAVPPEAREGFAEVEALLATPARPWRLRHRFFNSGLLAFQPAQLDLDLAERYLQWHAAAPARYRTGKSAIWFGDWTPEQTCYHVMFALADPPPEPLGDDYHLGGEAGHGFNHFLRHYLIQEPTLRRLRALVAEL